MGNLANRRQLKFVAGGGKNNYVPFREPPLKSEFDEWLVRIVCFAFSYPPTPFLNLADEVVRPTARQNGRRGGLAGHQALHLRFDQRRDHGRIRSGRLDRVPWLGSKRMRSTRKSKPTSSATLSTRASSLATRRGKHLGEEQEPNNAADQLMVTTATGVVPIGESKVEDNKYSLITSADNKLKSGARRVKRARRSMSCWVSRGSPKTSPTSPPACRRRSGQMATPPAPSQDHHQIKPRRPAMTTQTLEQLDAALARLPATPVRRRRPRGARHFNGGQDHAGSGHQGHGRS